jgi:hypothetical protein
VMRFDRIVDRTEMAVEVAPVVALMTVLTWANPATLSDGWERATVPPNREALPAQAGERHDPKEVPRANPTH